MINLGPNARDHKILSEEERKEPATGFHDQTLVSHPEAVSSHLRRRSR